MVTRAQREAVRRAYHFRCGYCGVHENEAGSELEIDHYQPSTRNGTDEDANLVYACPTCNKAKGDFWSQANSPQRILHPQRDLSAEHVQELPDSRLQPLTSPGAFHVRRLRLNRPQLVALRRARSHAIEDTERIAELEQMLDETRREISSLEGRLETLLERISRLAGPGE